MRRRYWYNSQERCACQKMFIEIAAGWMMIVIAWRLVSAGDPYSSAARFVHWYAQSVGAYAVISNSVHAMSDNPDRLKVDVVWAGSARWS
jgi:hypothetical protein